MSTTKELKKLIVVLGMHRSGTSAMAGALSVVGCGFNSKLVKADKFDNPKGYWEPVEVVNINDRVFSSNNMDYMCYWPFPKNWKDTVTFSQECGVAKQWLKTSFEETNFLVIKDPRLCRTLPLWRQAIDEIGITEFYIHVFRNPLDVVSSLQRRDSSLPKSYALLVWLIHTLDALKTCCLERSILVGFSSLLNEPQDTISQIEKSFNVEWPLSTEKRGGELDSFLSKELMHHHSCELHFSTQLEEWAIGLYELLVKYEFQNLTETFLFEVHALSERFLDVKEICFDLSKALSNEKKNAREQIEYRESLIKEIEKNLTSLSDKLSGQLEQREINIEQLKQQLISVEENSKELLVSRDAQLECMKARLEEAKQASDDLLTSRDDIIAELKQQLDSTERSLQDQLIFCDAQLDRVKVHMDEAKQASDDLLTYRDDIIAELKQQLASTERSAQDLLISRDAQLDSMKVRMDEAKQASDDLITSRDDYIADLKRQLISSEENTKKCSISFEAQLDIMKARLDETKEKKDEELASKDVLITELRQDFTKAKNILESRWALTNRLFSLKLK